MKITKQTWGQMPDGTEVPVFKLDNSSVTAEITSFGGSIVSLSTPDRNGTNSDIVLGYDRLEGYIKDRAYLGSLVGRHANRIENAEFEINGIRYTLARNDGKNHLHGGTKGFNKALWDAEIIEREGRQSLQLKHRSTDGDENYPGNLDVKVVFSLTGDNSLVIDYYAVSDADTVVNLTSHPYFNLSGHDSGTIENHELIIYAGSFTAINDECLPTGEIRDVKGTPMDFTVSTPVGPGLDSGYEQIVSGSGYDHNWVIKNEKSAAMQKAAVLSDPARGRVMEVYTTKPGMQFYSGNFLDGSVRGKEGAVYGRRSGLCLETQYFPNALKHSRFPSPLLKAGEEYRHTTIYRFRTGE